MKNRLMRPSAALFPLALFAAEWTNGDGLPSTLLIVYLGFQLLSLCAVDAFRNAAAREPGPRKADRRFWGSFVMLVFAMLLLAGFYLFFNDGFAVQNILAMSIPFFISVEHLFEERLFTLNRRMDGNILALIANGLLFAGMMLDGSGGVAAPMECFYTLVTAAAGAVISMLTSMMIAPVKGFSLIPHNLGFAPKAMLQTLLFPAACIVLNESMTGNFDDHLVGIYGGYALWRLSRTVCRRAADESRPLNLLLIAATAAALIAGTQISWMLDGAVCFCLALVCAMIVFLRIGWRNAAATILLAGGIVCIRAEIEYAAYIAIACAAIAVILNLKNAFLKKI